MDVVPVRARNRLEWVRGEQQLLPRLAARRLRSRPLPGLDRACARAVPRVTTIHDLNYRQVPDAHFGLRGLGMRVLVPAAARRSRRVVVDAGVDPR